MMIDDNNSIIIDFISKPFYSFSENSDIKNICIIEFKDIFYNTLCKIETSDIEMINLMDNLCQFIYTPNILNEDYYFIKTISSDMISKIVLIQKGTNNNFISEDIYLKIYDYIDEEMKLLLQIDVTNSILTFLDQLYDNFIAPNIPKNS